MNFCFIAFNIDGEFFRRLPETFCKNLGLVGESNHAAGRNDIGLKMDWRPTSHNRDLGMRAWMKRCDDDKGDL